MQAYQNYFISESNAENTKIEFITSNCEYFRNLFILIDNINYMTIPYQDLQQQVKKFTSEVLVNKPKEVEKESIHYLVQALSECAYEESSKIYRYILKKNYNVIFDNMNDHFIEISRFDRIFNENGNIFIEVNYDYDNLDDIFKEIAEKDKNENQFRTKKKIGDFFERFKTFYPVDPNKRKELLENNIAKKSSVNKLDMLLLIFPEYFEIYRNTTDLIFGQTDKNFLTLQERYYLAIMASATVGCDFLTKDLIRHFLINGGNESWLTEGLNGAPQHISNLAKINNIIAFKPWSLSLNDLLELKIENRINNFLQSIIILTTFQRMASLYSAMDIIVLKNQQEYEIKEKQKQFEYGTVSKKLEEAEKKAKENNKESETSNKEETEEGETEAKEEEENNIEEDKEKIEEKKNKRLNKIYNVLTKSSSSEINECEKKINEIEDKYSNAPRYNLKSLFNINQKAAMESKFRKFFDLKSYKSYEDFNYKTDQFLFSTDFSFDYDAYYNLEDAWPLVSRKIKEDFQYAFSKLTSNRIGNFEKTTNFELYRRAIVTYVEKIFGLYDDTFDFQKTNQLLSRELKSNIKCITCFPWGFYTKKLITMEGFSDEDLLHILFLSTITKQRLQLTYVVKVLNEMRLNED